MATRSLIGILKEENLVDYVYCHWDGYPSHNGKILLENYTTEEKVLELLEKGDLSCLGEEINKCEFYGEPCCEDALISTLDDCVDYIYLFHKQSGRWMYCPNDPLCSYKLLTPEEVKGCCDD